jgi:hypothetical protein
MALVSQKLVVSRALCSGIGSRTGVKSSQSVKVFVFTARIVCGAVVWVTGSFRIYLHSATNL